MKYFYLNIFLAISFLYFIWLKPDPSLSVQTTDNLQGGTQYTVVASGLNIPWEIVWGPDQKIWLTEQKGYVCRVDPLNGKKDTLLKLDDVWYLRTTGLLGMALHSDMKKNPYVFLNYTIQKDKKYMTRLVRYTWQKDTLINAKTLMEIPAANGHNGSRLTVHEGILYWATGDALSLTDSQNPQTPNGKILRMNIDGSVPADNPMKGNLVWAWGFRNIQGMVFSKSGLLYTSEHGDANDDEINLIQKTRNYGWPTVQGFAESVEESSFKGLHQTVDPLKAWTPTIGPAGLDYYASDKIPEMKNSLLLVTLKGKSLRSLKLSADGKQILSESIFFENKFGRVRDLCVSPAGDIYISTSNRDWNPVAGFPMPEDDRIIKISKLSKSDPQNSLSSMPPGSKPAALYQQYCASCHKDDGMGVKGVFPPLQGSQTVVINPKVLIRKVLTGSSGPATINGVNYEAQMPSFAFLKDEDMLEILGYVRSLGSNHAIPIKPETVKEVRASLNN
ncbi:PQQ-dependent sugar dehydrogenase [Daejeonella sp. H1SJ63]|jgi:glucose/arabinose dehydrogenase|uniref:PQQ-dependent sugar dehydrogenase n=1 Tax=Daejeonella sp. H1SJ63 TaxID=3034145 RepID=UPI0023ED0487|nr:PQQ-dependent sugar dehydrogenase [Daejeonella sp. H1SJ63]